MSPEEKGVRIKIEAITALIEDQEAYLAQLRLRLASLKSNLHVVRRQK
jgi:hypothetical protein